MAEDPKDNTPVLEGGAYEVIRGRLEKHGEDLRTRLSTLNTNRQEVFGAVETSLVATERITTQHNCVPRDMISIGENLFLFGYNVHLGLKSQTELSDVFAIYQFAPEDHTFHPSKLTLLQDEQFERDFVYLYKYYRKAIFVKFMVIGPHLYMAFRVGREVADIKVFKWALTESGIQYLGNRFDHEYVFPPQQEFEWKRAHRDLHRYGDHPHISIEDRIFVETTGGDLTIKIEDNTRSGEGIYSEDVADADQTLDDAEIYYAIVGSLILLKILPYQEKDYRFLVYNERIRKVYPIPAIQDSCVLLPDDHGLIFSNGYLLQIGEVKLFESALSEMLFERRIPSPNGEDYLFVFYNRTSGDYTLLSYNIITQRVETPILCNGYSIFPNGELVYFKTEESPQKHHVLQVWKTPFVRDATLMAVGEQRDSYLFKVGNADLVRCMAECHEILALLGKDDSFSGLYLELVKRTTDICDSYFWIDRNEASSLKTPLEKINAAAQAAIAEFDKVVHLRRVAADETQRVSGRAQELIAKAKHTLPKDILGFVHLLSELRALRGELISLTDVRYVNAAHIEEMEVEADDASALVSQKCVQFLQTDAALNPYRKQVAEYEEAIPKVSKRVEADAIANGLNETGSELELLIDIIGNLKIEDATQTTAIIDQISTIYAKLNQVKAVLKNRSKALAREEGVAQFSAKLKLLNQAVVNYLDLCSTPEKCEEFLTKAMIQLEELEGEVSEFDEYVEQIGEKRDEIYNAFESRKLGLSEERNRRAGNLLKSGERIISGIRHRVSQFATLNEINGYLAGDLLVEKVRNVIEELQELGDSVKSGDLQTQLSSLRDESVRQLKDKQELFVDGQDVLRFGEHKFLVNHQELELTMVPHQESMCFHLTGTAFFEPILDPEFLATAETWDQSVVSENDQVYRAEYLAYLALRHFQQDEITLDDLQRFMAPRYAEGYTKGVHDGDALILFQALQQMQSSIGLLRYSSRARSLGLLSWECWNQTDAKDRLQVKLLGFGEMRNTFGANEAAQADYVECLTEAIRQSEIPDCDDVLIQEAAEYLFYELSDPKHFTVSRAASDLLSRFHSAVSGKQAQRLFEQAQAPLADAPLSRYEVILDWILGYLNTDDEQNTWRNYAEEAAVHLLRGGFRKKDVIKASLSETLTGFSGSHPVLESGAYQLHYNRFMSKLKRFETSTVAKFQAYSKLKASLIKAKRKEMRLNELKPKVMSAFVRNRLLDEVYLPLVGANLAKQLGTAGADGRTDRMGLLLLVSPPGYGKTTLMEYIANRLGITFVKINGPAIGHGVTSLDPEEAPNASAREEVDKLNLALEMGDNSMIYLDDIQHCHPEFLQKFISLCDAQRKMEGVWKGNAQTYDLRGKKVAVVMAGNPYTESGGKFQIPDMLANRADTYNLGDILGGHDSAFKASYIENALTSNPILSKLASRSQKDVYAIMQIAETDSQDGVDFEGNYSSEEIDELTNVVKKLFRVRDTILRVNLEYIASAAQQDEFRTEPPFRLQGSYRNMNRIAERVLPLMTDAEVEALIIDHYENEAQNLTTGAEANLLKFREMEGILSDSEAARWSDIQSKFQRNLLMGGGGDNDPVSRVVGQLAVFGEGLESIRSVLAGGSESRLTDATLRHLKELVRGLRSVPVDVEVKIVSANGDTPEVRSQVRQSDSKPGKI